jgi:hypothetical protein
MSSAAIAAPYVTVYGDASAINFRNPPPAPYPQSLPGLGFALGDRFGMVAGEIGYGEDHIAGNANADAIHLDQMHADGIFYVPLLGGLNLLLTGGGAETNYGVSSYARNPYVDNGKVKTANGDITVLNGNEFDWRAGTGFSIAFSDAFEFHAVARYEPITMKNNACSLVSFTFGVDANF